eukprot:642441-Prorocentrum_minimum.AAC.1
MHNVNVARRCLTTVSLAGCHTVTSRIADTLDDAEQPQDLTKDVNVDSTDLELATDPGTNAGSQVCPSRL